MKKNEIGLIGLAVMGENLVLNFESKGYSVSVYNRTTEKVDNFLAGRAKNKKISGFHSLEEFVNSLERPRKIIFMVKAGDAVDQLIAELTKYIDKDDILIDGGNSQFGDTKRRFDKLEANGFCYIGMGVSGGEEGALKGPSLMPGGSKRAWPILKPYLQKVSAQVSNEPCCDWVGDGGAGHFVKMVHNGIEYGDMQLIAEIYQLMRVAAGMSNAEIGSIFKKWNEGLLSSYLVEITASILDYTESDGSSIVDHILDTAGQKGTGKWTAQSAFDYGTPLTLIAESVYARALSSNKERRKFAASHFQDVKKVSGPLMKEEKEKFLLDLENTLLCGKIASYAQGFELITETSKAEGWQLDPGTIASLWRGGCVIRSSFLGKITEAYKKEPSLDQLLFAPWFTDKIKLGLPSWRKTVTLATELGIAVPSLSSALSWFDGLTTENSPANIIQAQRDYFGAHTYERTDRKRGEFFHTNWTGMGGNTVSTSYNA